VRGFPRIWAKWSIILFFSLSRASLSNNLIGSPTSSTFFTLSTMGGCLGGQRRSSLGSVSSRSNSLYLDLVVGRHRKMIEDCSDTTNLDWIENEMKEHTIL
jgi:hypothetical protein